MRWFRACGLRSRLIATAQYVKPLETVGENSLVSSFDLFGISHSRFWHVDPSLCRHDRATFVCHHAAGGQALCEWLRGRGTGALARGWEAEYQVRVRYERWEVVLPELIFELRG